MGKYPAGTRVAGVKRYWKCRKRVLFSRLARQSLTLNFGAMQDTCNMSTDKGSLANKSE